ncbi:hypothetical protein [Altererythrobacter sp. MTPC7]|uniref:hypothetical protein n=1 Tax=Altererythrobacter sp. MTPC7 TaxID=3056567 RepID=UPI0036F32144
MNNGTFTRFQVYGQRCSGTNALIKLLERNLPELEFTEVFGFKHWLVPPGVAIPDDVFVVVIAREAGEWLRSLHAKPWHAVPELKQLDFAEFIRAEWRSVWDDDFWGVEEGHPDFGKPIAEEMCPDTGNPFANAIAMRTAKLGNWLDVAARARGHALLSHAQLVAEPQQVVRRIAGASGTPMRGDFVPVTSYKGQDNRPFEPVRHEKLGPEDAAHVSRYLDPGIERQFGV